MWLIINFIETNEKPADLSQRIVFKSKKPEKQSSSDGETKKDKKQQKPETSQSKLSFQVDDEEEDGDED